MAIRVLDPTVAAQIAAGEVVERPASVVRELVENALDAGARQISIEVAAGGLREIKVQDDGSGIAAHEIEVAFARHATSKLTQADDLWAIDTLGFRGEALPSIAAVAQVVCVTRTGGEAVGTELRIAGGEIQARTPRGTPQGTMISVRNLFYNVPVRREFLRSEATESATIAATVTQYALAYPHVRFTLLLDGRQALQTSGGGDLRAALIDIYGIETARQMLPVAAVFGEGSDAIRVSGMISPPGLTRSTRSALHLFVNRRAIQPRGQIPIVIEEAYHTLLMRGRHPLVVLGIDVHPAAVDVNVHPTKSEVKFRDAGRVMGAIGRAVRDALVAGADVHDWDAPVAPLSLDTAQRRFELRQIGSHTGRGEHGTVWGAWEREPLAAWDTPPADVAWNTSPAVDGGGLPELRIVGQVARTYIVADTPEGMLLIDQHAAHERVIYERLAAQHDGGAIDRQSLLLPQVVEASPELHATLLGAANQLDAWGFEIEDFGAAVRVRAAPAGLAPDRISAALIEIGEHLQHGGDPVEWRSRILTTLACHSAVRAGQALAPAEMAELTAQLARCAAPLTCPHGRPTVVALTRGQLERQFGRSG